MDKSIIYKIDTAVPFPLAYLDWCKNKKITDFEKTKSHMLVMKFWKIYIEAGGHVEPWELTIAKGESVN